MSKNNLLVEIGTEELPPKALSKLAGAFEANVKKDLEAADLAFDSIKWYAAPRRLALKVTGLESCQPDKDIEKKGPALKAAYDKDGKPTKAAEGWAKSNGITVDQAEHLKTDKGEWLFCRAHVKGKTVEELVPSMVQKALAALPVPKMMHWGATKFEFVRPVHTVTLLYGTEVIPCELFGIKSDRIVRGHRFMGKQLVTLQSADDYPELLEKEGMVIADYDKRKEIIRNAVIEDARKLGGEADLDESLLDEVTLTCRIPGSPYREIRGEVPEGSLRGARLHHEGRPEVLPRLQGRQASAQLHLRRQHPVKESPGCNQRQRESGKAPPFRCRVLL